MQNTDLQTNQNTATDWQTYLRLLSYLKGLQGYFALSIFGFVLFAATQAAAAHLLKYFVDGLSSRDAEYILMVPAALVAIAVVRGIGFIVGNYFITKVSLGIIHKLRCQLFEHYVRAPKRFYDKTNVGEMMSVILYNVGQVSGAATDAIKVVVREGFTVVFLMSYLFWMNWKMTLFFLAVAPVIGVIVYFVGKRLKSISKRMQVSMGDITHTAKESLSLYQLVKAYGGEQREIQRFNDASEHNVKLTLKLTRTITAVSPTLQLIIAIALAGLMFSVLRFFTDQGAGDVVAYITAAGLIPKPVRQISDIWGVIQRGLAASESIFEVIDSEMETDQGDYAPDQIKGEIRFDQVRFRYDSAPAYALDNVSFTVDPGQMVALVGQSGSGKTTVTSLLLRLYNAESGGITLDGKPLSAYKLSNLRSHIALVSQNVELFNGSVRANVCYGSVYEISDSQIWQALELANAKEFVERLEGQLDARLGENGTLLSGGQKQRLAITRAILKGSKILVMDEATSALDSESERLIQDAMEQVAEGRTSIVIAHRLSTIMKADRIIVFREGEIVEQGNHQELLAKQGTYAALHKAQFSV